MVPTGLAKERKFMVIAGEAFVLGRGCRGLIDRTEVLKEHPLTCAVMKGTWASGLGYRFMV